MRKLLSFFFLAAAGGCFLLAFGGFVRGAHGARRSACLLLGLTALICGLDHFFTAKAPSRPLGWGLIWTGVLYEAFVRVQSTLPQLQPVLENVQHFSFIFWFCLFSGIGILIRPLFLPLSGIKNRASGISASESPLPALLDFLKKWNIELLIVGITVFSLSPLLKSGYYWDDAVNATAYLFEKQDGLPLMQNLLIFMRKYIELGRINVLSCYYYFFFLIENVALYKALIIGLVCVNVLQFGRVAREAGASRRLSLFAMLLIPTLIQFRAYQDPVTGFYGLMQVILAELLFTAYFLLRYLHSGRRKHLILSLLPFTAGLMTYEVCFPFILMIPLLVLADTRSLKKAIRVSVPYVVIVLICLGAIAFVRANIVQETTYAGVAVSLDFGRILQTYTYQLAAALPLSFYAAGQQLAIMGTTWLAPDVLQYTLSGFLKALTLADIFILVLTALAIARTIRTAPIRNQETPRLTIFALGLSLWLLPAVTIAVSQRYQGQLLPGLGYLPVYLEYFGISLLLSGLGSLLCKKLTTTKSEVFGLLAVVALLVSTAINLQNNRKLTDLLNREFLYPRLPGEQALQAGLLSFLPTNSKVIFANPDRYIWEADWNERGLYQEFASIYSPRDLIADGIEPMGKGHFLDQYRLQTSGTDGSSVLITDNLHILSYSGDAGRGLAKLGHVNQIRADANTSTIEETLVDQVLYFVSGELPETVRITYQTSGGETIILPLQEAWQIRRSREGNLYQLPEQNEIIFETLDFFGF